MTQQCANSKASSVLPLPWTSYHTSVPRSRSTLATLASFLSRSSTFLQALEMLFLLLEYSSPRETHSLLYIQPSYLLKWEHHLPTLPLSSTPRSPALITFFPESFNILFKVSVHSPCPSTRM